MSPRVLLATVALVLLPAAPADATSVLTTGSAGGAAVSVGDQLSAPLASGQAIHFYNHATHVEIFSCSASSTSMTVLTNPISPGTATASLHSWTINSCTVGTWTGVTGIQSVLNNTLPYNMSIDSSAAVSVSPPVAGDYKMTIRVNTLLGVQTGVYKGFGLSGTFSNVGNSITYTNQLRPVQGGAGVVFPTNIDYSFVLKPVTDTSASGALVFLN